MGIFQGIVAATIGIAAAGGASAATTWTLVDIGTLGGPGSYGSAISNTGAVTGCSDVRAGGVHAFIYRDGALHDLGTGSALAGNSCGLAVDNAGNVAGRSASGELVVWSGGSVTTLGVQGNIGGMNDGGIIVGSYLRDGQTRAFMYQGGTVLDLGGGSSASAANAVNARGEIVGSAGGRAFLYDKGAMLDLGTLGGNTSVAKGINDRGQVVGMASNGFGQPTPFIYDGAMRELPGGSYASAIAINQRVQVVASAEGRHGYLVVDGAMTLLDSMPAVQALGWRNLEPTGINDQGWIVGTGVNDEGDFRAFLLVPREGSDKLFARGAARGKTATP